MADAGPTEADGEENPCVRHNPLKDEKADAADEADAGIPLSSEAKRGYVNEERTKL